MTDDIKRAAQQSIDDALELRLYYRQRRGDDYTRLLHTLGADPERATHAINSMLMMQEMDRAEPIPNEQLDAAARMYRTLTDAIEETRVLYSDFITGRIEEYTNGIVTIPAERREIVAIAMRALIATDNALRKAGNQ